MTATRPAQDAGPDTAAPPGAEPVAAPVSAPVAGPPRRRGAALESAIHAAAYAELAEAGYAGFSVESVAERAGTGKASIYRRWPTKQALVLDALCAELPAGEHCLQGVPLDEDTPTREALVGIAVNIARMMASPAGAAMRAIKCESAVDPDLARLVDERFQAPRRAALIGLLERGIARGEVRPDLAVAAVADVLPAMLTYKIILQRDALSQAGLTAMMEDVLIPLVELR